MGELLERDGELEVLRASVVDAASRRGCVVLIAGEAGIGKSSLVAAWTAEPWTEARVLAGWCDDFLTSRTLGPLRDLARVTGGALEEAVSAHDTAAVLDALMLELDQPLRPTVVVLEDVHWADEATLDVIRYVGRRIERLPAVLAITYREDELDPEHPLHGVLGALRGPVHRLSLHPLSSSAVAALTESSSLETAEIVRITGGNPFFVSEIARGDDRLPASVADAVTGRLHALPAGVRTAVERLSVVPGGASLELATASGLDLEDLALAEAHGLLVTDGREVAFRHELARLAVASSLPAASRIGHHRAVLEQLLDTEDEAAILHHAVGAGRRDVVAAHGPAAARGAFHAGAYRQAEAHQRHVLDDEESLEPTVRAELLEDRAWTLYNLHRFDDALSTAARATELRARLDDPVAHARALTVLSRMHYMTNDPGAAIASAEEARLLFERHGDDEQRVEGLVTRASTYALVEEPANLAMDLTEQAVTATEHLDRPDLRSLALNYRAVARCAGGRRPDPADFREAIRLALRAGRLELAARAYTNLAFELLVSKEPTQETLPVLDEALAFVEDHDLLSHAFDLRARRAAVTFALGRWEQAEHELRRLRASSHQRGMIDLIALETLARLALRRGDATADELVDSAWFLARRSEAAPYLGLIGAIRLEQAWLEGDAGAVPGILAELPLDRLRPRMRAEVLRYAQLAGAPVEAASDVAEPWAWSIAGDWRSAVRAWREDQRPYELAVELVASREVEPTKEALHVLDGLGAAPAARLARRQLRELGVRHVPRGPRPPTRQHPAGLTERQAEVLELLAEGLTNAQIAERLVVSVRTVDHHVAAVLQKLGVTSRREAVERDAELHELDYGWR